MPVAAILVVLAAVVALADRGHKPVSVATGAAPTTTASTVPGRSPAPAVRSIPDFVWVAARNAARYRVEFAKGARVVLTATTASPRLHVSPAALPPGTYRWRVWALTRAGARDGAAIVDPR